MNVGASIARPRGKMLRTRIGFGEYGSLYCRTCNARPYIGIWHLQGIVKDADPYDSAAVAWGAASLTHPIVAPQNKS